MKEIKYKQYNKKQMLNIIKSEGFVFVETNLGDNFIIKMRDIPDFIMLESVRTSHCAEIEIYIPGVDIPVITTFGCFLNKTNPVLREEIIDRLVLLQTNKKRPKNVKIFNNDTFSNMTALEMGIEDGHVKNFDKFYGKYKINTRED